MASSHTLTLVKTAEPSLVRAGALLTYTLDWSVAGNEPAPGVTVADSVPANTTFVTADVPVAINGGQLAWPLGDHVPGDAGAVTFTVRLDLGLASGCRSKHGEHHRWSGRHCHCYDHHAGGPAVMADLAVAKTGVPNPVAPGATLTYTLVVSNLGPDDATGVVVTDSLPAEVEYLQAAPAPISSPNPLVWNLGGLAAGASRSLTVTVHMFGWVTSTFTNTAAVGSLTPDSNPGNNITRAPVIPLQPGLTAVKTVAAGPFAPAQPFTYTIRIINTGGAPFATAALTDTLPGQFHFVPGSGAPTDPNVVAEPTLVWSNLGPLAVGQTITVSFNVTATPGVVGVFTNAALAAGTLEDGTPVTTTTTVPVTLQDPSVAVDKRLVELYTGAVDANYFTFTIAVTNTGPTAINLLPMLDSYDPANLTFVRATPSPDVPNPGALSWLNLAGPAPHGFARDLLPGQSFNITTVFTAAHGVPVITNTVVISHGADVFLNPTNSPTATTVLTNVPTAVTLLWFRAQPAGNQQVRLSWSTAVEVDNFGFRLYRAGTADRQQAQRIAFVPAQGRGSGATYVYTDTVATAGAWWYWLADVSTTGLETSHVPARASVTAVLDRQIFLPLVLRQ